MLKTLRRHAAVLMTSGAVVAALVMPAGAPAGAAPVRVEGAQQAASLAERPVLSSPFGTARSRVVGTYGRAGTVRGYFVPRRFEKRPGKIVAIGRLHAVLVRPNGTIKGEVDRRIVIPVRKIEGVRMLARQQESCQILNLVLGPLDLNLLGLEVHLSRVVLNIEATPGPGNLLGNLLCAIAGLLDNNGVLRQITQLLNAILAILRL